MCTRLHADWVTLFGPDATILKQHMGNRTITPWQSLSACIDRYASSVIRVSHMAEGVKGQWRETYMTRCADEYTTLASTIPWYLDPTLIQAFRRKWGGTYTFLMVDKNSGRTWVMCRQLFLRYVRLLYEDDVQFETLHTLSTVKADMLLQSATEAGLAPFLQRGPSFGVPCSFVFVKNKSNELIAELKWRILFSHFHHPLKKYGQRVGRALTLLKKTVVQVFDTWAILNTGDVREFAGRVESSLSKLYPDGIPPKKRPRLFELDVKEMFPRFPRDGVISAITSLASVLTLFLKTPPPPEGTNLPPRLRVGKSGLIFSIHKRNRKLDKLGKGYASEFHILTMQEVINYLSLTSTLMIFSSLEAGSHDSAAELQLVAHALHSVRSSIASTTKCNFAKTKGRAVV